MTALVLAPGVALRKPGMPPAPFHRRPMGTVIHVLLGMAALPGVKVLTSGSIARLPAPGVAAMQTQTGRWGHRAGAAVVIW